jgi:hypothetical protein
MRKEVILKDVPFTYNGMLLTIEEIELHAYALIFASLRLSSYLDRENTYENIRHSYDIPQPKPEDFGKFGPLTIGSVLVFSGGDLISRMQKLMPYFQLDFYDFRLDIVGHMERIAKDTLISRVYELINNYAIHHKRPQIINHLKTLDWYQMMNVLRNNASHFNNYGKAVGSWSSNYPNEISWEGFMISRDHFGDEIHFSIDYAFRLVRHCANYISENQQLFTDKSEPNRDVTLKFITQRKLFEKFVNIELPVQRPDLYQKIIDSKIKITHNEKGNLGYSIDNFSEDDLLSFHLLWNHFYRQNKN